MRYLFTLACLIFVTTTVADEPKFDFDSVAAKKALRDYKKAMDKDKKAQAQKQKMLDEDSVKTAKETRDAFVANLKKALKKSMQAGNLDEANKIDAAIKALQERVKPIRNKTGNTKDDNPFDKIAGDWRFTWGTTGGQAQWKITKDGKLFYAPGDISSGSLHDGRLLFLNRKYEYLEIIPQQDRLIVLGWSVGSRHPLRTLPDHIGIATRIK